MGRITLYLVLGRGGQSRGDVQEPLARRPDPAANRPRMASRGSKPRRQLGGAGLPHAGGDPEGAGGRGARAALRVPSGWGG